MTLAGEPPGTEDCRASQGDPTDSDAPGNPTRQPGESGKTFMATAATAAATTTITFVGLSWPQTAASTESRNSNSRQTVTNNGSRSDNNTVGGPYHPPLWHCHGRGRRRGSKADITTAGRLQANHRGTEDCRASQGDPTDSDAPGNPTRKPGAGGETTRRRTTVQQQDSCMRTTGAPRIAEPARATRPTATHPREPNQ